MLTNCNEWGYSVPQSRAAMRSRAGDTGCPEAQSLEMSSPSLKERGRGERSAPTTNDSRSRDHLSRDLLSLSYSSLARPGYVPVLSLIWRWPVIGGTWAGAVERGKAAEAEEPGRLRAA